MRLARLGAEDLDPAQALVRLMAEVFELEPANPPDEYLRSLLERRDFWAVTAFSGSEVVGGVTAYTLPMMTAARSELFIYDLAVLPAHQRQGVGRRLVAHLCAAARAEGVGVVFVPADDEDLHALDFYRAIGGVGSPVTFFELP